VLDEADLDPPLGMTFAPLGGEMQDFLVALAVARTVADEQEGCFISSGQSIHAASRCLAEAVREGGS
jgi:hypothetical protein